LKIAWALASRALAREWRKAKVQPCMIADLHPLWMLTDRPAEPVSAVRALSRRKHGLVSRWARQRFQLVTADCSSLSDFCPTCANKRARAEANFRERRAIWIAITVPRSECSSAEVSTHPPPTRARILSWVLAHELGSDVRVAARFERFQGCRALVPSRPRSIGRDTLEQSSL
jgi:hypothetical protein